MVDEEVAPLEELPNVGEGEGADGDELQLQPQIEAVAAEAAPTTELSEEATEAPQKEEKGVGKKKSKKGDKKKAKKETVTTTLDDYEATEADEIVEAAAEATEKTKKEKGSKKKGKEKKKAKEAEETEASEAQAATDVETTEAEAKEQGEPPKKKKKSGKEKKEKTERIVVTEDEEAESERNKKKEKGGKKEKKEKKGKGAGDVVVAVSVAATTESEAETEPSKKDKKKKKEKKEKMPKEAPPLAVEETVAPKEKVEIKQEKRDSKRGSILRTHSIRKSIQKIHSTTSKESKGSSRRNTMEESSSSSSEGESVKKAASKSTSVIKKEKKEKKGGKKGKKEKKQADEATTEATEETGEPKPKKAKGAKGGKKGKRAKTPDTDEELVTVHEPEVVDIMAEINMMKAAAQAQVTGEGAEAETVTIGSKKKEKKPTTPKVKAEKGPKKKLSKKEKARLAAEMAEKARIEAELEAARAAEEERIRLEAEKRAAIGKEKREIVEQAVRIEQLEVSQNFMNHITTHIMDLREQHKDQVEWELYVNCGKLPNPSKCDQMNTYLHLWEKEMDITTIDEASKRTTDILHLLADLDYLIDTATPIEKKQILANWKWVRLLFREHQAESLDVATYRLLRDIERNLHRIDIPTADFHLNNENIAICLWLKIPLPTPLPNPRRPAPPQIIIDFTPVKIHVQFPLSITCEQMALRAMYLKYDHLSDLSATYERPPTPEPYEIELFDLMKIEWWEKQKYKYDNRDIVEPPPKERHSDDEEEGVVVEVKPPKELTLDDEIPLVPYKKLEPTASEFVITKEDLLYAEKRESLLKTVADDEINLRKFSMIGGVFLLNLIHLPPQPQQFVTMEMEITPLYIPKKLEMVDFYVQYKPPAAPEPGVRRLPEEIEEDLKRQEEEFDKLMLVTLTWPDHVIYLELPLVCHWNVEKQVWTRRDIHDLKHNEEKGQLTFRTGRFGTFGLAAYRYANLPYQAWELRPETDGSITLQITAAILMLEFKVGSNGLITLSQLQNSPNNALQNQVGVAFPLPKLIRLMQDTGIDVFPAFDAFCYVEGTCEKHWPMERHLYFNMAQLGICFNFAWSRWNMTGGRRSCIMQMREYSVDKIKQRNHNMLLVTPTKAILVDCTEVSQNFSEDGIESMKFYSDLYYLMKGISNMAVRSQVNHASQEMVYSLYELLVATRVLSFS